MELATINHTEIHRVFSPIGQWKYHEYRHIKPLCHPLPASYLLQLCSSSFATFSGKGDCLRPCPATDRNNTKPWACCHGRAQGRPFPFSSCLPWGGDRDTSPIGSPSAESSSAHSPASRDSLLIHIFADTDYSVALQKSDKPWVMVKPARYIRTQTSGLRGPEIPGAIIFELSI